MKTYTVPVWITIKANNLEAARNQVANKLRETQVFGSWAVLEAHESFMDDKEKLSHAIKLIDELICLFPYWDNTMDYSVVTDGLKMIAEYRRNHPEQPITVAIARYMEKNGYV